MDEIKKAYRKLALKYHPKNNSENETAQKRFVEVNEAYNALNSEIRRQNYDNILYREMVPTRAHNIFEDFMGDRFFNMPSEE
jgi:curved DNA-binding protein CbpA